MSKEYDGIVKQLEQMNIILGKVANTVTPYSLTKMEKKDSVNWGQMTWVLGIVIVTFGGVLTFTFSLMITNYEKNRAYANCVEADSVRRDNELKDCLIGYIMPMSSSIARIEQALAMDKSDGRKTQ